jgi:threonine dehydrogenase-like Zn-dependent dehydrogenase
MMQTVRLEEPGRFCTIEVPEPAPPSPGEALVAVRSIGLCGTDQHAYRGRQPFFTYPRILGHELGVEVLAVGEGVTKVHPGSRCAVQPYLHCGACTACRKGKTNCCVSLKVLGVHTDGGWQPRLLLPADLLHPSSSLNFEQLALVETLAIGAHAVQRAEIRETDRVLILGAGPIGLATWTFARQKSPHVTLVDISPQRLHFAHATMGAANTLHASGEALLDALERQTAGELADAVFDCTGSRDSMLNAFHLVAHGGRLIFVGLFIGDVEFHDPLFHKREMTLLASRNAVSSDFTGILAMMEAGTIDTAPWITHRGRTLDAERLLPKWLEPSSGLLKAMLEP